MDSANILSIMNTLGQGQQDPSGAPAAPVNVMQPPEPPPPAPAPVQTIQPADVAQAATAASPAMPKQKHSLLDTIGRISDVLARVGGAEALYQPTLDARADRETKAEDHARQVQKDAIDLATSKFDLTDKQTAAANDERSRFASVLDAVNDPEDAANLPAMMQAAGLTDPKYAPFIQMVQKNPDQAKVLSGALGGGDGGDELGKQIKTGYDKDGNRVSYIVGSDGNAHILTGVTPDNNLKVVNTGGTTAILGADGKPLKILPNTVSPNTVANNTQSDTNNRRTTSTQITIAGMPARSKPGAANSKGGEDSNVPMYLDNIRKGFADLHQMQALPGEGGALNQVEGAIGRTGIGQKIGEQMGTPAAQKRLEIAKNVSQLQQAMLKSLPASATRTKFEQEMLARGLPDPSKMDFKTANRVIDQLYSSYQNAIRSSQASSAPAASTGGLPRLTPEQAAKLPSGTRFIGLDGQPRFRH